jgi:hypothetical protein
MNCPHQGDGWCLGCVKQLQEEKDYLLFFRHAAGDFMGPGEQDCIDEINRRYTEETGSELPIGWKDE